jgi:hypothetical protein
MATRMQQRRGTAQQWTDANPRLAAGEIGFETDTGKFKVGDDVNFWNDLAYFVNADDLEGELGAYATEEFVNDAVSGILDGAPGVLNTLNELAAALGDDPSFITTIGTTIDTKADTTYVTALIGDATVTGVGGNTVTSRIASAVSGLVDSAPGTLNTLNELAEALGDDPNFATTVSTNIGTKVSKSGDTMTGALTLAADPTNNYHAATKSYVDVEISNVASDFASADAVVANSVTALSNTVDGLTDTVDDIIADAITDAQNLATLGGSVDVISGNVATLTTDLGSLTTDVGTLTTDLGDVTSDLGNLTTEVGTKSPTDSPTFTGTVVLPTTTSVGDVSSAELGHLNGVTSAIQTQIDAKAPTANPTFTGTVSGVTKAMVGLGDVDNTADEDKPISSAAQAALDLKAPLESPTFTGTVSGVTKSHVGLGNVDNTNDADKPVSTATQTALDAKASLAGATFTGNVEVDGNIVVDGNLTVNGTEFIASATSITIEDNLIQIAHTNPANTVDLGVVVAYNDGTAQHAGIVRDVSANTWKLFKGVESEPATTVAFGEGSLDDLELNNVKAAGVVFADGTQTKVGVPSLTEFVEKTASYTLDDLDLRDGIVEMNSSSATTFTIPTNATLAWPVGASMDILGTGTGEITIAGAAGVTVNSTPGLKLRTRWSSATILKRAENSWIAYGDLKA